MTTPTQFNKTYTMSAQEISELRIDERGLSTLFPDSIFSTVCINPLTNWQVTRVLKAECLPPLDETVTWVWWRVSALHIRGDQSMIPEFQNYIFTVTHSGFRSDGQSEYSILMKVKEFINPSPH